MQDFDFDIRFQKYIYRAYRQAFADDDCLSGIKIVVEWGLFRLRLSVGRQNHGNQGEREDANFIHDDRTS